MANIFSLTVLDPSADTKAIETQIVARSLEIAAQQVRSAGGLVTSGTITGDGHAVLGSWTYTPTATK